LKSVNLHSARLKQGRARDRELRVDVEVGEIDRTTAFIIAATGNAKPDKALASRNRAMERPCEAEWRTFH
jgi:hypothetical protein